MQPGNAEPGYAKLMPIYDALDGRNYKQGLKLLAQCAPKFPRSQILPALRCLALYRTGQQPAARRLLAELRAARPTDDAVLGPLSMVLRAEEDWRGITDMYRVASEVQPGSVELAEQTFYGAVREGDAKEMQRLAQGLVKRAAAEAAPRYVLWQVGSIYLQALQDGGDGLTGLQGKLVARMLEKLVKEGKALEFEVLRMYVDLLEAQGNRLEAITACCRANVAAAFGSAGERLATLRDLYASDRQWAVVGGLARHCLEAGDRDEWAHYCAYLDALGAALTGAPGEAQPSVPLEGEPLTLCWDREFSVAHHFLNSLVDKDVQAGSRCRGPSLALLELFQRGLRWREDPAVAGAVPDAGWLRAELQAAALTHVEHFGLKPVGILDVMPYVVHLSPAFLEALPARLPQPPPTGEPTIAHLQGRVALLKLQQALGALDSLNPDAAMAEAVGYVTEAAPLCAAPPDTPERAVGEDLVTLAALLLVRHAPDLAAPLPWAAPALWCLEAATGPTATNSRPLLLKALLYGRLGICAAELLQQLAVKYVQLDTLTWLCLPAGRRAGDWARVRPLSQAVVQFHRGFRASSPDDMAHAFQYGSYTKLREFRRFAERLSHSVVYLECGAETLLWGLLENASPDKVADFLRGAAREVQALQRMAQSPALQSNEDLAPLDILLPGPRDGPSHRLWHSALLPPELQPSLTAGVAGRARRGRFVFALALCLQALLTSRLPGPESAAPSGVRTTKKGPKGKKGARDDPEDDPNAEPEPMPELPALSDALQALDSAWTDLQVDRPTPLDRLAYEVLRACVSLPPNASASADDLWAPCVTTAADVSAHAAASGGDGDVSPPGTALQPLGVVMAALGWAVRRSGVAKSPAAAALRPTVQAIAGLAEALHRRCKALLGTPKAQLWAALHPGAPPVPPAPPALKAAEAKVLATLAEHAHHTVTMAEDALREYKMEADALALAL